MVADVLAPCIASLSAAIVLTMLDRVFLVPHGEAMRDAKGNFVNGV